MKKVRIWFDGFWDGFDQEKNFIFKIVSKNFDVELSKTPDFVFTSCFDANTGSFGTKALQYNAVRILFLGENLVPDFTVHDYGIGFSRMTFGDRYLRFPLYHLSHDLACYLNYGSMEQLRSGKVVSGKDWKNRKFCAMVVSNPHGKERNFFFEKLYDYKRCDSGGRFKNNLGGEEVENKEEFLGNYRFSMAFENSSTPGYVTEKIVDSFLAGTIPIYWGAPDIAEDFNPKAFINCHDYKSFDDVVGRIRYLEEHPEEELAMMREPIFTNAQRERYIRQEEGIEEFLVHILGQDRERAYRRNSLGGGRGREYEETLKMYYTNDVKLRLKRLARTAVRKFCGKKQKQWVKKVYYKLFC